MYICKLCPPPPPHPHIHKKSSPVFTSSVFLIREAFSCVEEKINEDLYPYKYKQSPTLYARQPNV